MRIRCRQNVLARTKQAIEKLSVGAFVGASRNAREQPGQPNRAGQDAQASQIEPVEAKLGQAGRAKSLGRTPRALEAAKPSHPAPRISQLGKSSWVTSLLT